MLKRKDKNLPRKAKAQDTSHKITNVEIDKLTELFKL